MRKHAEANQRLMDLMTAYCRKSDASGQLFLNSPGLQQTLTRVQ